MELSKSPQHNIC